MGEVDGLEVSACGKHHAHRQRTAGVEVLKTLDVFELAHACKPCCAVARAIVGIAWFEHHGLHVAADATPLWASLIVVALSCDAHAVGVLGLLGVITEGQHLALGVKHGISLSFGFLSPYPPLLLIVEGASGEAMQTYVNIGGRLSSSCAIAICWLKTVLFRSVSAARFLQKSI